MKSKKLLLIFVMVLVTLILLLGVFYVVYTQINQESKEKEPTIDEIISASVDVPEITTNLADKRYVKIEFKIQTNSEESAEELKKRDFQVKNIIIQELSELTQENLEGKEGKQMLQQTLKSQINELMNEGEVQQVYITSYVIN